MSVCMSTVHSEPTCHIPVLIFISYNHSLFRLPQPAYIHIYNIQSLNLSLSLSIVILDSFLSSPDSQTIAHGATLILFCIHGGSLPPATITWTHNNDIIVTSSRVFIQQSTFGHTNPPQVSSSLAIASAVASDSGSYACVASNPLLASSTDVTSSPATVTVRGKREYMIEMLCENHQAFLHNCCNIEKLGIILWPGDDPIIIIRFSSSTQHSNNHPAPNRRHRNSWPIG
jgi:hypothetical protein